MSEHTTPQDSLPARAVIDARTQCAPALPRPLDHTTGEELTSADLHRTLLALRGLDRN